jgi:hypothetical protein
MHRTFLDVIGTVEFRVALRAVEDVLRRLVLDVEGIGRLGAGVQVGDGGQFLCLEGCAHGYLWSHALGRAACAASGERRGRGRARTPARYLRVFVLVFGIAGDATRTLDVLRDHRDDYVVREPALPRTVIVQSVTKPKLALLHPTVLPRNAGRQKDWKRPRY